MRRALLWVVVLSACATPSPAPATSTAAPVVTAPPPSTPCGVACARIITCIADPAIHYCPDDCEVTLGVSEAAQQYRDRVLGLSCDDIRTSVGMDEGPLGYCYSSVIPRPR